MPGFNGAASIISNDYSSPATLVCALFSFDGGPESSVYTFVLKEGIVKNLPSPLNGDAPVNVKKINNTIMLNRFASIRDDMFDINHDFIISTWSLGITGWKQIRPSGNETGLDKSAETLFYADLAFKEGEFEKAAYGFKSIVNNKSILDKHKEIYARALYYLAKSYQASGNIKSAVIQYEEFVNLFSTHIFADNAQKESQFLDMSSRFGDTLLKHYLNANNLFLSSEHDKAFEIIRYALSESRSPQNESYIQPLLCRAFYLAGQLSEKLNIHDQALSYYEKGALCAGEESVKRQCVSSALRLKK
jgi:tetratricopeptide (TPR) repeat protein